MSAELRLFPEVPEPAGAHAAGVLPSQMIAALVDEGRIAGETAITEEQIQPASLDLRLGARAYRVRASFLPGANTSVAARLEALAMHEIDLTRGAVLERGCVYVAPLMETLRLPKGLAARANPKSSIGRIDVFVRLIAERAAGFDQVPRGYRGGLWVEIAPRSFSVLVRAGDRLNQLRFQRGATAYTGATLAKLDAERGLVFDAAGPTPATIAGGLRVSVDLVGEGGCVGYRARRHAPVIDLAKLDHYDAAEFWDTLRPTAERSLVLDPDAFYILASKERLRVPPDHAAEMAPYDVSIGEFRVHYAGFFDPGFGHGGAAEVAGTRAVLEVRSHEVPFLLEDGQPVGRLVFEPLLAKPEKIYGAGIGSSYQGQGITLAKQFRRG